MEVVAAGMTDQSRARAIAAIRRATVSHQNQHAVGIPMHKPGHGRVRVLAARIGHLPGGGLGFLNARNHLPPDRAVFIRWIDEIEKVRGDGERQFVVREFRAAIFFRR